MIIDNWNGNFRDSFYTQQPISRENFFAKRDDTNSRHRKIFGSHSAVQKNKSGGKTASFSVWFAESILPIYETMTEFSLTYSKEYNNFWHYLNTDEQIHIAESWEMEQGQRVFLKDNLFSSIALSLYNRNDTGININNICQSSASSLFFALKYKLNTFEDVIIQGIFSETITRLYNTIRSLPFYNQCRYIAAVPPRPGKATFDLPSHLAACLAQTLDIEDITPHFIYGHEKAQVKSLSREEKWQAWEDSCLSCQKDLGYNDIILIDDLYQSGISVNFVGMKLQQAHCGKICGLYLVKSLNDRDNIQRNPESLS